MTDAFGGAFPSRERCVAVHAQCCSEATPGHLKAFRAGPFYLLTREERQMELLLECISFSFFFFFNF